MKKKKSISKFNLFFESKMFELEYDLTRFEKVNQFGNVEVFNIHHKQPNYEKVYRIAYSSFSNFYMELESCIETVKTGKFISEIFERFSNALKKLFEDLKVSYNKISSIEDKEIFETIVKKKFNDYFSTDKFKLFINSILSRDIEFLNIYMSVDKPTRSLLVNCSPVDYVNDTIRLFKYFTNNNGEEIRDLFELKFGNFNSFDEKCIDETAEHLYENMKFLKNCIVKKYKKK